MSHAVRKYRRRLGGAPGQPAPAGNPGQPQLVITAQPSASGQSGIALGSNPTVQVQDAQGNNVAQSGLTITVTVNPSATLVYNPFPAITDATGKVAFTNITITGAVGSYTLSFAATGFNTVVSNSISIAAGTPSPAKFTAVVPNGIAGQTTTITVQARDSAGNACTSATNGVTANVTGANTTTFGFTNNNNGTYSGNYLPLNTGTDTIAITADGTAITGSPFTSSVGAGGNLYPNLPSNLVGHQIYQYDGNLTPNTSFGSTGMTLGVGVYQNFAGNSAGGVTDASAPVDPSLIYNSNYPVGLVGGNSNAKLRFWDTTSFTPRKDYYDATWFKIVESSFEAPGPGGLWKLWGYVDVGAINNHAIYNAVAPIGGSFNSVTNTFTASSWNWSIRFQNNLSGAIFSNGGISVACQNWYRVETHMVAESAVGAGDGTLEVWITNVTLGGAPVKIINSSAVYLTAADPIGFNCRHFDPIWGGGGGNKTVANNVHFARFAGFGV